jgi:sulfate permease, SulP family
MRPDWLIAYRREWVRADVVAGLTTSAVVIPQAMAYAVIAGLPVQLGLYTALLPAAVYAALGTSRPLSVSTTSTLAILTATALANVARTGDPAALTAANATLVVLVGAVLLAASVLRLGFVADFISAPVLVGFKAGLGVVILVSQIPKLLGIHTSPGSFLHNVWSLARGLPETSIPTLMLAVVMLALLTGISRLAPRWPAPLIAVACGIAGAALFGLPAHGVALVGYIPRGLPSLIRPDVAAVADAWPSAVGIALMSFTETAAVGRAFVGSGEPVPRANRELLATGVANLVGGLFSAMPAGGGTSQTSVNRRAGARTQVAQLVTAAVALATILLLAPVIAMMPQATLAAVVVASCIGLIQPREFQSILTVRRTEFTWALTAFAGVMLLGTLKGIIVAIAVSLVALAHQATNPPVYVLGRKRGTNVFRPRSPDHPDDEVIPGLLLVRLEGRIFFANAAHIGQKLRPLIDEAKPAVVAIDFSGVTDIEYTALKMLVDAERRERERGVLLWFVGLNREVLAVIQRSPLGGLGRDRMFFNLEMAVARYMKSAA